MLKFYGFMADDGWLGCVHGPMATRSYKQIKHAAMASKNHGVMVRWSHGLPGCA